MDKGTIVGSIDAAQVAIWLFWVFFAGLIYYLHREDKREGYPLISDRSPHVSVVGFPEMPSPKTFLLPHGGTSTVPRPVAEPPLTGVRPVAKWPGAPLEPTGNPMKDGVGPASYALRSDTPDMTYDGHVKIVPLRVATDFTLETRDPDPRGMPVIGTDRKQAGTVTEVWVDRAEVVIRYLEVRLAEGKTVLLPWNFCKLDRSRGVINVKSILASQFFDVPTTKAPDQITFLEEDKIMGYYGGGHLYATAARAEPLL